MTIFRTMGVVPLFFTAIIFASVSSTQLCSKLSDSSPEVECENLNLVEFPDFTGFTATTYKLNGNSFAQLTSTIFPPGLASEIQITKNEIPLKVDRSAFHSLSSSLAVLKLQNVDFDFDGPFMPVAGIEALNSLELGNKRFSRNLTVPFLDDRTMNRLIWLKVVHSGVENVQPEALDSEFRRLRLLGFSHNKLRFIPDGIKRVMTGSQRRSFELDLSANLLDTVLPEWFPSGCTLTTLDLSYNNIRSVRLRAFDNCPHLSRLVLEGNAGLLYLSPSVFPNNCHLKPHLDVLVQHTGLRNVEFALRSCVGRVIFWNASVPCTCRHRSLLECEAARELFGECLTADGQRLLNEEAKQHWSREGCQLPPGGEELYSPKPLPDAGDPLASLKDWGKCLILDPVERDRRDVQDGPISQEIRDASTTTHSSTTITTTTMRRPIKATRKDALKHSPKAATMPPTTFAAASTKISLSTTDATKTNPTTPASNSIITPATKTAMPITSNLSIPTHTTTLSILPSSKTITKTAPIVSSVPTSTSESYPSTTSTAAIAPTATIEVVISRATPATPIPADAVTTNSAESNTLVSGSSYTDKSEAETDESTQFGTEPMKRREEPMKSSEESTGRSEESTKQLEESTKRLEESTKRLEESTKWLEESTKLPEQSTKWLEESTKLLEESTKWLEESTKLPEEPTKQTEESSKQPEESTKWPEESTKRSEESTKRPEESTERPKESTKRPEESTKQPAKTTKRPDEPKKRTAESTKRPEQPRKLPGLNNPNVNAEAVESEASESKTKSSGSRTAVTTILWEITLVASLLPRLILAGI